MIELLQQIKIVLMDIDGTLIRGSDDTIDNVMTQLRRLKPLSIRFSVATGRTLFGAQRIIRELSTVGMKMPPVIAYNGAVVAWPEEAALLHRFTLPPEPVKALLDEFRSRSILPFVYTCQSRFDQSTVERVFGDGRQTVRPLTEFNGMPITWLNTFGDVPAQDVVAILGQQPDASQDIRTTIVELGKLLGSSLRITSSGNHYVEVSHPLSTKANGLKILAQKWGVEPSQIMTIGDNYNDVEMLATSGVGVAVANAPEIVKKAAKYVCQREAAEGVVEALRLLLGSVRQGRIESRVREEHNDAC